MVNAEFVPVIERSDVGIHEAKTESVVGRLVIMPQVRVLNGWVVPLVYELVVDESNRVLDVTFDLTDENVAPVSCRLRQPQECIGCLVLRTQQIEVIAPRSARLFKPMVPEIIHVSVAQKLGARNVFRPIREAGNLDECVIESFWDLARVWYEQALVEISDVAEPRLRVRTAEHRQRAAHAVREIQNLRRRRHPCN